MTLKKLKRLIAWELEEYWSLPVLELVVFAAVIAALNLPVMITDFQERYLNLGFSMALIFVFLIFTTGSLFARSFAGSLSKGEMKTMFSYPLERTTVFISKFVSTFLMLSVIFAAVYSLNVPLLALDLSEPMFYVSLAAMVIQLFLLCTVATAISLVTRNEIVTFLAHVLLFFGIEVLAGSQKMLSSNGRYEILFDYFLRISHGISYSLNVSSEEAALAVIVPLLASALLFVGCLFYFTRVMEID
jgi:ABC-type transport system involved in multi-copper enzyme maturation permease subunit